MSRDQCDRSGSLAEYLDVNETLRYANVHAQVMTFVLLTRRIRIHCQSQWVAG
jgi:hypothetical protein